MKTVGPRLADRLALRPREAAAVLGISVRKLREMLPELPHVRRGRLVMLPVNALQQWLDEEAEEEGCQADAVVDEILATIGGKRK